MDVIYDRGSFLACRFWPRRQRSRSRSRSGVGQTFICFLLSVRSLADNSLQTTEAIKHFGHGARRVASQVPERERERRSRVSAAKWCESEMRDRNDSRASQSQVNNTYRLLPYKSVCASLLLGCHAPGLGAKEPMITAKSINRLGRQKGRIAIRLCSKRSPSPLQLRKVSIYAVKSVEWVAMAVAPLLRLQIGLLTPAPFCELIKFLAFQQRDPRRIF